MPILRECRLLLAMLFCIAGVAVAAQPEDVRVLRNSIWFDVRLPPVPEGYLDDSSMVASYVSLIRAQINDETVDRLVTLNGKPISTLREVLHAREVIALHPKQLFFWPYIGEDHVHNLDGMELDRKDNIRVITRCDQPRVLEVENFLSEEEADLIVALASPRMKKSTVVLKRGEESDKYAQVRTSSNVFIDNSLHPTLVTIAHRVANLTRTQITQAEDMQVIHYSPLQHYHAHFDYIDHETYPTYEGRYPYDNRYATVLFYLSNVTKGGATVFPKSHPYFNPVLHGYGEGVCNEAFNAVKTYPKKGNAVIFYSMDEQYQDLGVKDDYSLHGGCDVLEGEKWAANYWIHNYYWWLSPPPKPWPTGYAPKKPVPPRRRFVPTPEPEQKQEETPSTAFAQVHQDKNSVRIRMGEEADQENKKEEL